MRKPHNTEGTTDLLLLKHGLYFQADGDWVFAVAKLCEHLMNSVLLTSPYIHNLKQSNDTDGEIQ